MNKIFCMLFISIVLASYSTVAAESACSKTQERASESEVDHLKNWQDVYKYYNLYDKCENASAAEGVNDVVDNLLANEWDQLPQLNALTDSHEEFRKFVLSQLNCLTSSEQEKRIKENASHHCGSSNSLCQSILEQLKQPCVTSE